jgi:hypothetical protein
MALEKPSAGVGAIISTEISASTGTGTDFLIKTIEADFDHHSPDVEVTGDGDYAPKFENNGLLYGDWRLHGAMVSNQAVGLSRIVDGDKNETTGLIKFILGGTNDIQSKVLIRRVRLAWKRSGYFVGVSILLRSTHNTSGWASTDSTSGVEFG